MLGYLIPTMYVPQGMSHKHKFIEEALQCGQGLCWGEEISVHCCDFAIADSIYYSLKHNIQYFS